MSATSAAVQVAPAAREVTAGARATYAVFAGPGLAGSTWSSRLPQVRAHPHLDPAPPGVLPLTTAVGGVIVLPLSGTVVTRLGPRRDVTVVALPVGASLGVIALGYAVSTSLLVTGLFVLGAATGFRDVAMTLHAAAVERGLGRPVMPRFFAAFSLGAVAGAAVGVLMSALRVPAGVHAAVVAAVIAGAVPAAARHFLPEHAARPLAVSLRVKMSRPAAGAWREPRAVAVGLVPVTFAVAEGAGNNWVSVPVVDRHHVSATIGTPAYASFLAELTAGRRLGPAVLHRFARAAVLRTVAAFTPTGVALFALGPSTGMAFAGSLLRGPGAAVGFPVTMSAGADEPPRAAERVGASSPRSDTAASSADRRSSASSATGPPPGTPCSSSSSSWPCPP